MALSSIPKELRHLHMLLLFSIFLYKLTEGYSGSDIRLVCKEAAMRPVRKIFDILELHEAGL